MFREKVKWRSFDEARKFVHELNLKSSVEWQNYCAKGKTNEAGEVERRPFDIPASPSVYYMQYWKGWHDWLGPSYANQGRKTYTKRQTSWEPAPKTQDTIQLKYNPNRKVTLTDQQRRDKVKNFLNRSELQ